MYGVIFALNIIAWLIFVHDPHNEIGMLLGLLLMCLASMMAALYYIKLEDRIATIEKKLK